MTYTVDTGYPVRVGKRKFSTGTIAFDASYPTDGEAVTAANLGFGTTIDSLQVIGGTLGYVADFDKTASKIRVYYADNNGGADGPLIEFPNATSLAAITAARFIAFGW